MSRPAVEYAVTGVWSPHIETKAARTARVLITQHKIALQILQWVCVLAAAWMLWGFFCIDIVFFAARTLSVYLGVKSRAWLQSNTELFSEGGSRLC